MEKAREGEKSNWEGALAFLKSNNSSLFILLPYEND